MKKGIFTLGSEYNNIVRSFIVGTDDDYWSMNIGFAHGSVPSPNNASPQTQEEKSKKLKRVVKRLMLVSDAFESLVKEIDTYVFDPDFLSNFPHSLYSFLNVKFGVDTVGILNDELTAYATLGDKHEGIEIHDPSLATNFSVLTRDATIRFSPGYLIAILQGSIWEFDVFKNLISKHLSKEDIKPLRDRIIEFAKSWYTENPTKTDKEYLKDEAFALILHEILHIVFEHIIIDKEKEKNLGHETFNILADLFVNTIIAGVPKFLNRWAHKSSKPHKKFDELSDKEKKEYIRENIKAMAGLTDVHEFFKHGIFPVRKDNEMINLVHQKMRASLEKWATHLGRSAQEIEEFRQLLDEEGIKENYLFFLDNMFKYGLESLSDGDLFDFAVEKYEKEMSMLHKALKDSYDMATTDLEDVAQDLLKEIQREKEKKNER